MTRHRLLGLIGVAVGAALGTWLIGWWAVLVVALAAGLLLVTPIIAGVGCAIAWALLLAAATLGASFGKLSTMLSGVMGLPAVVLIALTVLFPLILGWSAASVGNALRSIRPGRDQARHMT